MYKECTEIRDHVDMYRYLALLSMLALSMLAPPLLASDAAVCSELLDHDIRPLGESEPVNLCQNYQGKVVLIVNTASRCAFTPQYEDLENLYRRYRDQGLVVLGFPSNDFGNQEPGTEQEIKAFCELTYDVGFPMFEKVRAARGQADPVFERLGEASGEYPGWNFHKYLLDRNGRLAGSFPSRVKPQSRQLLESIEALL
jgi:glutathione peroxidase